MDMDSIFLALTAMHGWTPQQIGKLTWPQAFTYLIDGSPARTFKPGGAYGSMTEMAAAYN